MDGEQKIKKAYESILVHDFEQAIEWFEAAVEQEPNNAGYHYKLSITYARSGKLPKALGHAKLAYELEPEHEEYRFHLQHVQALLLGQVAEKMLEQGEVDLAISYLKKAVDFDPLSIEAYLLLAVAYAERRDYKASIQALQEVLKLDPRHEAAKELSKKYKQQLKDA